MSMYRSKRFINRLFNKFGSVQSSHAIAPVYIGEAHLDGAVTTSVAVTTTINTGETVVVFVGMTRAGSTSVSTVVDSGGSIYTKQGATSVLPINSDYTTEVWGCLSATSSSSLTVTVAGAANMTVGVIRYTGVNAFGNTTTGGATASTTQTMTLTMQDKNNVILSGGLSNNIPATASIGTLLVNDYFSNQGSVCLTEMSNTSVNAGSLSTEWTSAAVNWCACAIELRSNP